MKIFTLDWGIFMAKKREFGEGPIYTITNYVFWFMMGSIYFGICNIPFLFIFLTPIENPDSSYLVLLVLSLIPMGPSITALMSAMGKLVRDKDSSITKDYFKAYKQSFGQSLFLWVLQLAVLSVIFVDISFFKNQSYGFIAIPVMYALAIIVLLMGLYAFPIISRFYLKTKDVIKLSFYYSIGKIKITFLNISAIIIGGFVIWKFTSIGVFVAASGVCYLIMFYEKDLLKDLEEKLAEDSESSQGSGDLEK
jgi:uncharacterized membrane protein YesL